MDDALGLRSIRNTLEASGRVGRYRGLLQRLDKLTTDEARMAAIESLNTLHIVGDEVTGAQHGVQSTPKALEDRIRSIEYTLEEVGVTVKEIRDEVINGTDTTFNWPSSLIVICVGFDRPERQMATNLYGVATAGSNSVHGSCDKGHAEELECAWKRARNINKTLGTMKDVVARLSNGAQDS
jgi:hypothetical protein